MAIANKIHGGSVSHEAVALFLQEIIVEYDSYKMGGRRADKRESVSIPVQASMLDNDLRPVGVPFYMVTRDISCGGVGLFSDAPVVPGPILLTFSSPVSGSHLPIVAWVGHCTPCGRYFIIGCRFSGNVVPDDGSSDETANE